MNSIHGVYINNRHYWIDPPEEKPAKTIMFIDGKMNLDLTIPSDAELAQMMVERTAIPPHLLGQAEHGLCRECGKRDAVKDYNGCNHWVCDVCYGSLNNYFDEEYK